MNLTAADEMILSDIDRLVDWYRENMPDTQYLVVSKKQKTVLAKIARKMTQGQVFRRSGEIDIQNNVYRGMVLVTQEERRRRRAKDTEDMFS